MSQFNTAILETAGEFLGLEEWPGAQHNPAVVGMFEAVGHGWVKDDETPWCAAFVGSVLAQLGLPHTGKLNARSYLEWGENVALRNAEPGDVVVFWRKSTASAYGHVAFLVRFEKDRVLVRGGNQGNKISDIWYPVSRILGVRRLDAVGHVESKRPVLRKGSRGAFVLDLQDQLRSARHFAGQVDGIFGPLTDAAVRAFQAESGLVADGVVGRKTWAALEMATPRPERDIAADDLRKRGSSTMKNADLIDVAAVSTGGIAIVDTIAEATETASGFLPTITELVTNHWPALVVIAVAVAAFLILSGRIKSNRVERARTGAHLGR